ncbi:MAG TPA: kelch repeat-containing protein [Candidatus Kapabacteria bacterium]|nr:kelch repeat-containing protein [Candidatus Kapabacteria bacterium]
MHSPRAEHSAVALPDGRVLVAGGQDGSVPLSSCEIYDPATNTWQVTGSMHEARFRFPMILLQDGRVMVAGGLTGMDYGGTVATTAGVETYDIKTGVWTQMAPMHNPRETFPIFQLPNGKVFICGGLDANVPVYLGSAEFYDPSTNLYQQLAPMPTAVFSQFTFYDSVRKVIYQQGGSYNGIGGTWPPLMQEYSIATNTWSNGPSFTVGHDVGFNTQLPDGSIVLVAGRTGSYTATDTIEILQPKSNAWQFIGRLTSKRWYGRVIVSGDDSILAIGGNNDPGINTNNFDSTNWFFVKEHKTVQGPRMISARSKFAAVLSKQPDSNCAHQEDVYVFGGLSNGEILSACEALNLGVKVSSDSASAQPQMASTPFPPVIGCSDTSVWELLSIGCSQFRIDSVRIESDTAHAFHLDSILNLPRLIGVNGSDSVHVIFEPHGSGTVGARLHLFGTLLGSDSAYDTVITLVGTDSSASIQPEIATKPIPPVAGCSDTSVWELLSIGCSQFRIDSVEIEGDTGNAFRLDSKQKLPRLINDNGSDSIHVFFVPDGRAGTFGARLHLHGTLSGSGAPYDTIINLQATSTSTGNPLPTIRYTPFAQVQSCSNGDAYAFYRIGCTQFRIDSVRIVEDTANVFEVDPTQKFPQLLTANNSDSVHVLFRPNHRLGGFGAKLELYGTDMGSGVSFDTVLTLLAESTLPIPLFYASTDLYTWSSLPECSSGDTIIKFVNQGCDTVSADSLHLIPGLTLTSQGLTLPTLVPPNGSISLRVHFVPDGLLSDSLQALLYYSSPGYDDSIPVQISAQAHPAPPVLLSSASKVNFGSQLSCDTVDTLVYFKNTGCDSLTITSISNLLHGFSNDPPLALPITLAKGDSIALHVRYRPISSRDTQTVFIGTTSGNQKGVVKINLAGQIRIGELAVLTPSVSLSSIAICGSADTTITVSNPGCDTMVITSASLSPTGDVQLVGVTPPIVLPPNTDTTIELHFAAKTAENFSTTLTLYYEDAGIKEPHIDIPITAVAINPQEELALSDTALSIASLPICASDSLHATLYNPGCDTLIVSANELTGDPDFVLLSALDSIRILPDSSVQVNLAIVPQQKGTRNALLHIHYWNSLGTAGTHDSTIDLSAFITNGASHLTASLASANLGTISECASADTLVTLQNTGCDTLTIDSGMLDNNYFTMSPDTVFPVHIPPNSAITWRLDANLDTAGHPSNLSSNLRFTSPDTVLAPIPLSYSIYYAVPSSLALVPMTGAQLADSQIYYDIRNTSGLAGLGVNDVRFSLHVAQDVLGYKSFEGPNVVSEDSTISNGIINYNFNITGAPVTQWTDGTLARLWFRTYVALESRTAIWIDSAHLNPGDPEFERCTAYLRPSTSDTTFDLLPSCGDSALRKVMSGQSISMSVRTEGGRTIFVIHSPELVPAHLRISNLLGSVVSEENLELVKGETDYEMTQPLPDGPFFVMLSDANGAVARAAFISIHR